MSILLHQQIWKNYRKKRIHIKPFIKEHIGPNSYDVRLGPLLKVYVATLGDDDEKKWKHLDVKKHNPTSTIEVPKEGLILQPGRLYLGNTIEAIGSDYYLPMYEGRSSMARLGIESHISAGFGDVGFKGQWTLEIQVVHPIRVYPGMRIGQVYFHQINQFYNKPKWRYHGKYATQTDPQESRAYLDYEHDKNDKNDKNDKKEV